MLMAHIRKYKIKDYWATDHLIGTSIFDDIMPRDRFWMLLKFLHFNGNANHPDGDKLYKRRAIVQRLKDKFRYIMVPYRNLCIDERLILWKRRLHFTQHILSKQHRFGIKIFSLCDYRTGFLLDFVVYVESGTQILLNKKLGIPGSIVMTLMQSYLQKGHSLFVDTRFTSLALFEALHANGAGARGTIRKNRFEMPHFSGKLEKSDSNYRHTDILLAAK